MRLIFAGTPQTAVPALRALLASRHEVVAVLTRPDTHVGRRGTLTPSAVAAAAETAGIPVMRPASIRTPGFAAELDAWRADAVAVVAYGALIPEPLLTAVPRGWINLHFSLLPAWRGAAPVQAAIRAGDDVTGATTFLIEKGLDTGPVYGTLTETIRADDTAGTLLDRLSASGARLLVATFDALDEGAISAIPQAADGVSVAPKIAPEDARVDFTQPALAVDRLIRSVTPAPGAWTDSRWGRLGLGPVRPVPDADPLAHGEIVAGKREVLLGTATVPVRLSTVQPPGKRALDAADWARGARPEPGERFGAERLGDEVGDSGATAGDQV